MTFGYIGNTNYTVTFGYKHPAKPLTIGYNSGTIPSLTIGYIHALDVTDGQTAYPLERKAFPLQAPGYNAKM